MTRSTEDLRTAVDGDAVDFYAAGDHGKGEFRCSECGYGIAVCRELPICPMCGCEVWETASWRPFARAFETTTLR